MRLPRPCFSMPATLLPARPSKPFARVFAWYLRRTLARSFHAVRLLRGSREAMRALEAHDGPAMALFTHSAWWDPLTGLHLANTLVPSRQLLAPMDIRQLQRFAFFRKLGLFGIDPDDPASLEAMANYVERGLERDPRPLIALTPQGTFADPRAPIVLRPGAAALAARLMSRSLASDRASPCGLRVAVVAIEYVFWTDRRPELLLNAQGVELPPWTERGMVSTATLQRAFTAAFASCAGALAERVIARDEGAFEAMGAGGAGGDRPARIHPLYDAWLRLRGRSGRIEPAGRRERPA